MGSLTMVETAGQRSLRMREVLTEKSFGTKFGRLSDSGATKSILQLMMSLQVEKEKNCLLQLNTEGDNAGACLQGMAEKTRAEEETSCLTTIIACEDCRIQSLNWNERNREENVTVPSPVSRRDLLDLVSKHSDGLPRPNGVQGASSDPLDGGLMDARYWREVLDLFFVRGWGSGESSAQFNKDALFDDMLFFVRSESGNGEEAKEEKSCGNKPYFVRRWSSNLTRVVGNSDVDWRRSFYLNLICHTTFTLTVAVCSRRALEEHKSKPDGPPVTPIAKITKRVYASPNMARLDSAPIKAQEATPTYPQICFAIDDFNDAFQSMELRDPDHCLCVLLNSQGGAAFPATNPDGTDKTRSRNLERKTSSQAQAFGEAADGKPKVTIFSGFVSYHMLKSSFHGGRAGSIFSKTPLPPERLAIRGPGGLGEAEIIVSCIASEQPQTSVVLPQRSPRPPGLEPMGLPDLKARLSRVQGDLMKLVLKQQESTLRADISPLEREKQERIYQEQLHLLEEELKLVQQQLKLLQRREKLATFPVPVQPPLAISGGISELVRRVMDPAKTQPPLCCCLRSISLPWDTLSYDLLFKERPVKVDITGHLVPRRIGRDISQEVEL